MKKAMYFLFGAIMPIPIFFDLASFSFVWARLAPNGDGYLISAGSPVPFGIFSFFLMCVISFKWRTIKAVKLEVLILVYIVMLFTPLSVFQIGIVRTLMLFFPFLCFYFSMIILKNPSSYKYLFQGYIISFGLFVFLHFLSFVYYFVNDIGNGFFFFNSIFGVLIYQALVSYSAVLSFGIITLIFFQIFNKNLPYKKWVYVLIIMAICLLTLGARKAVILDVVIVFMLISLRLLLLILTRKKINRPLFLSVLLLPLFIYSLLSFTKFSDRVLTLDWLIAQRGGSYVLFFNKITNSKVSEFFFGFGEGWGGFSNIYIELAYRVGFFGLFIYSLAMCIGFFILIKALRKKFIFIKSDFTTSAWMMFTILTIIISNIFNMNIQLPYYTINLTMIGILFIYYTKKVRQRA